MNFPWEICGGRSVVKGGSEVQGMSDEEILRRLKARDPAGLSALVDAYAGPVYALAARILDGFGSQQDVEECASDAFYAAWERVGGFDSARAPLKTWLLMLAKYAALERRRHLSAGQPGLDLAEVEPWVTEPGAGPEEQLATAERRAELQQALDALAPVDRELVYRRYFVGERVDRVAGDLGLTRQAADNRLWRARKQLREFLLGVWKGVSGS